MSTVATVARLVVDALNAGSFTPPFTAEVEYLSKADIGEFADLKVTVTPKSLETTPATRDSDWFDVSVWVAVRKRVQATDAAALEELLGLVESIMLYMRRKALGSPKTAGWSAMECDPIYVADHLDQWNQFTALISLTYRVRK